MVFCYFYRLSSFTALHPLSIIYHIPHSYNKLFLIWLPKYLLEMIYMAKQRLIWRVHWIDKQLKLCMNTIFKKFTRRHCWRQLFSRSLFFFVVGRIKIDLIVLTLSSKFEKYLALYWIYMKFTSTKCSITIKNKYQHVM